MASTYQEVESEYGGCWEREVNLDTTVDDQVRNNNETVQTRLGNNEARIIHILVSIYLLFFPH